MTVESDKFFGCGGASNQSIAARSHVGQLSHMQYGFTLTEESMAIRNYKEMGMSEPGCVQHTACV
jgi:hypothetical protein